MIDLLLTFLQIVFDFNRNNEIGTMIEHSGKDTIEGRGGEEDL